MSSAFLEDPSSESYSPQICVILLAACIGSERMTKISSGRKYEVQQKLVSAVYKRIEIANELPEDIVVDTEEGVDGSKPSLVIRIKKTTESN